MTRRLTVLVTLLLATACGNGEEGADQAEFDPFDGVERAEADVEVGGSAHPRWEEITTVAGDADETVEIVIAEDALQWRATWSCDGDASMAVEVTDTGDVTRDLVNDSCPGQGEALSVETGVIRIDVTATGEWNVALEQYVDTYLTEPPLAEMEDPEATLVAEGGFTEVERGGEGRALLYKLPDGSHALRFEGFATVASPDLFVLLSEAEEVENSGDVLARSFVNLGEVVSTFGDQNYVLPDDIGVENVKSIVIWCEPIQVAYTAAALTS